MANAGVLHHATDPTQLATSAWMCRLARDSQGHRDDFPKWTIAKWTEKASEPVLLPGEAQQVFSDYLGPRVGSSLSPR